MKGFLPLSLQFDDTVSFFNSPNMISDSVNADPTK